MSAPDLPVVTMASRAAWFTWLEEQHASSDGCWLLIAKKDSAVATVTYLEAVEGALCFGWIDGQRATADEPYYRQRFTPRRRGSRWSRINRDRATALSASGEMRPAGLAEVAAAKDDGRWDAAYEGQATAAVPPDLQAALDADPVAAAFFAGLTGANRYAILYRIQDAKRPETRAARIEKYVAMCHEGTTLH